MTALSPWFLLAGLTVAVPIFLHLFQRHQTRRLSFPALRYLERTEKEHARRIRLRQLLLLLARVTVLLLLVGAGARLVFLGRGASHPPTAVAIVLDNSMSSGMIVGERRALDAWKELALAALAEANDADRFWVVRAGEPWLPAIPGGAAAARAAVEGTEPSAAAADLTAALERAQSLLASAELPDREIHLLSDLQRSSFRSTDGAPTADLPVVVLAPDEDVVLENRALTRVVVGGGLPPLEGQRTSVTVTALGGDTARVPVRVVVNERIRGAATLPGGAETSIGLPPAGSGWILGYADADPDALRADDRRFFAYRSRPAPVVSVGGAPGVFVAEALAVLENADRVRTGRPQAADLLVAQDGEGLDLRGAATTAVVIPPADATVLPALNRRLIDGGIPWRYTTRSGVGEATLTGAAVPEPLEGVTARAWYGLEPVVEAETATSPLAEVAGRPWALEGVDDGGRRWLLVASPMDATSTTLPVSTGMLRFIDWVASEWSGAGGAPSERVTGSHLPAPGGATHVRFPSGDLFEVDGTRTVRGTGEAGFYTFLAGDSTVSVVALNPPPDESRLEPLSRDDWATAIGPEAVAVERADGWSRAVYRARQGPELWWPLLLATLLLLIAESWMATSGRREARSRPSASAPRTPA